MESQMNYDPIVGKLVPNAANRNISQSVNVAALGRAQSSPLSPESAKEIEYEEDNPNRSILDIDGETSMLDKIQEAVSDEESAGKPEPESDLKRSVDSIIQESFETSNGKVTQDDTKEKAENLVDQIREIISQQFDSHLRSEKETHFGIKCNQCLMEPIIGVRYK